MKTYTENEIAAAVELYAAFHDIEPADVDLNRVTRNGAVVAFRLSLDGDGAQRGADEYHPDRETYRNGPDEAEGGAR